MKFKVGAGILGILALLVGGYVGMTLTRSSARASQTLGPMGKPTPSKTQAQSVGSPAIRVKNTVNQATPNAPRISKADVETYVQIHHGLHIGSPDGTNFILVRSALEVI